MVYESSVELIKLDDGKDGQQGKTGYIWVKYSENSDGSNMTDDSTNAVYMGIAYNKESQTESTNPADYTWIKILGDDGEDGIGISNIQNKYAVNSSPTTPPTTWYDTLQTMTVTNKYLWNYEIITKTDGSSQESIKRVIGVYGDTGEVGVGIESITEYFLATSDSSGVTTSTSGWTTSIQTITPTKKYLWNYEVVHYTNDTDYTSTPVIIGAYGEQGIPGDPGEDGVSTYFYIRYSENSNGNNMTTTPNENSKYMGVCSTTVTTAPTTASEYTWSLIKGADGEKGSPGKKGDDGRTSYLHIKYSNDGITFTSNNGETIGSYIGTYVDFTEADSTTFSDYNWKKFVGEDGQDGADAQLATINASSQIFKAESGSNTYSPENIVLTPTFQNCTYVRWQYSTNGTSWINVTSGNNGLTINTVNNVQNCLTISNSTTLFTGDITSLTFKLVTNNSEVYDTMTITQLKDGQDGVSLDGIEEYFLASYLSTGITTSTSGWSATVPTITSTNKYLWNYEKINYSSGDSVSTTPRIIGVYGETGQDGVGIENITNYYLATADGKNITTSSKGWTATPQTITNEKKYLWNYSEISYSDESTYQSNPVIIGTYGDAGVDSVNVILSNESHSFIANSNGNAVASSITNSISGYKGTTKVATTVGTITGTPTGMSVNINNNNSTNTTLSISVTTSMTTRSGVINIPVTVNGVTITKQFSYSLSLAGANGQDGDDGADAYTVFLSNQNHSFNCDASGNISTAITTTTTVVAYKGTSTVTPTIGTLPTVTGLTLSKSGAVITIKANTGTSLANNGSFTIPVTVDGLQFSLVFSYSKLLDNESLVDDIEQIQKDVLANQTEITNVKSIADANAAEILNKVSTDTFNNQVNIIQNDLEKANNGLNNWLIEIYPRNLFKTEDQSKCTIDVFSSNSGVLPSQTLLVSDESLKANANYGDNYIGYALTFVHFDTAYTLSTNWTHNKGASLYLNGGLINSSANSATSQNISIQFKGGWNCLEVVINETTGNDGFVFGTVISKLSQCKLMNCYYGSVTGRQSQVINKLVELKIDADSIESRVQKTEETITTQDGKISTLTNQYSSLVQDLTGFKTTVSNTYVKNEEFEDTTSSLQESIETVSTQTAEKFDWLIRSGDSETNFTLTDRTAELITQYINLHGSVTFSGISTEAKQEITNNINSVVDEVKENVAYRIEIQYALGTSNTTAPNSGWSTTAPAWQEGKFMWQRTVTTYGDGSSQTSNATCISGANGAKGDRGDTGVSVKSVTPLYYCSNSTSIPTKPTSTVTTNSATAYNTWNKACPTWTTTYKYYYVCSEILFDNNTRVWSDVVADNGLTTANGNANTAKDTADSVNETLNANKGNWDRSYALVDYWTDGAVSDTTLINGGYIKTNTITADKIAIGDFSNYVDDPTFELDIYKNSGSFSIDSSIHHTGSKSLKMAAGATNYTRFILNNYKNFPVSAGDYLYIEWWGYRNNANQTARINIALRNALGDGIVLDLQNEGETFMPITITNNTWVKYSYVAYVTNGGFAEISFKLGSSDQLSGNWYIDDVIVRKMSTGELIVDGAISADKLATDAIKSRNYSYTSGTYSTAGTFLDLSNGMLRSKNFAIDTSGNAFLRGEITAKDGDIYLGDDGFKLFDKLIFDTSDNSLVINASEVNISGDPIATKKYSDRENLLIGSGGYEKDSVVLWEGTGWEFTPDTDMLKIQLDTDTTETELDDWAMIQIYKGLKTSTTYTLSVGLRSNMSTFSIYCATGGEGDENVTSSKLYTFTNVTTAWKEFKITWTTSNNECLYMYFLRSEFTDDGYIDLRYMMLEEGDEATDWIPCKYDSEAVANYFKDDLDDKTNDLGDSIDSLTEKAQHTDDQIEEIIADDGIIDQAVNASKAELSTRIDANETNISATRQELYDYQDTISRYMTFSSLGLILGMEGSAFTSRLTESELGFYNDANKLSWFSGNQMHIKEAVIEDTMTIGNLVFKKRNNGNISLVWRD